MIGLTADRRRSSSIRGQIAPGSVQEWHGPRDVRLRPQLKEAFSTGVAILTAAPERRVWLPACLRQAEEGQRRHGSLRTPSVFGVRVLSGRPLPVARLPPRRSPASPWAESDSV